MFASIIRAPIFWLVAFNTTLVLIVLGAGVAWLVVPEPPKYHRTTFFEFALPDDWRCEREGTETVCMSYKENRQAIIIFAAKLRNQQDTLKDYYRHLSTNKNLETPDGEHFTSVVNNISIRQIGLYNWVDATHFQSEIPNYYTRYLATNTAQLGILITFSYHKDNNSSSLAAFAESILALRIYQNN